MSVSQVYLCVRVFLPVSLCLSVCGCVCVYVLNCSVQDYNYHVMCKTSTEQYVVPVFARGPRPILDFPDDIVFPVVAVKDSISKTILVRNIGDRRADIVLTIEEYVYNAVSFHEKHVSETRSVTCHIWSQSVTCHQTQVNAPPPWSQPAGQAGTRFAYPDGRLSWP